MTRSIMVSLSAESIDAAAEALERYADDIGRRADRAASEVADSGLEAAEQALAGFPQPYATGELASSFFKRRAQGGWEVGNGSRHAAFFEFGTGVRGSASPYPYELPEGLGWTYDANGHGEAGWRYMDDGGGWHWTAGIPSRPFMAPAALRMRQHVPDAFREAFR